MRYACAVLLAATCISACSRVDEPPAPGEAPREGSSTSAAGCAGPRRGPDRCIGVREAGGSPLAIARAC